VIRIVSHVTRECGGKRILGHASLQITSIYVRAERQRKLDAAAQYYSEDGG